MRIDAMNSAPPPAEARPDPPLFVLANPGSGASDAEATRQLLSQVFDDAGRRAEFIDVGDPAGLAERCKEAGQQAAREGGVLVAVGGDGTINAVAQAALAHGCPLGIVPQGTFNLFARNQGIPQDASAAARALLAAQPEPVQVGWLNEQLFLVNASLGLYPQILHDREEFKSQWGRRRWVAVLAGLHTLFEWRRQLRLEIELGGEWIAVRTPTLFVGNNRLQLERIGIEAEVTAPVGSGRLAGIVVRPIGTMAMLGLALRGGLGQLGEASAVHSFAFRTMTVYPGRRARVQVATDGEVRWMAPPLQFAVSQQPLVLMRPRPEDRAPVE